MPNGPGTRSSRAGPSDYGVSNQLISRISGSHLAGAFTLVADHLTVGVQLALAAAFWALAAKQLPSVVARSAGNLVVPSFETSALAGWALDHIWPR